jgi:hypothetical protein
MSEEEKLFSDDPGVIRKQVAAKIYENIKQI